MPLLMLLIGVNRYDNQELEDLKYCDRDSQELAIALQEVNKDISSVTTIIHADNSVTWENVNQSLDRIVQKAKRNPRNTTIIFYFSGHGLLVDNQKPVLCFTDTNPQILERGLPQNSMSIESLQSRLANSQAARQIVIIDACHSGGVDFKNIADQILKRKSLNQFFALLSCGRNQQSFEDDQFKHGLFTYFLIKGIREGRVNIYDLFFYYLTPEVSRRRKQLHQLEQIINYLDKPHLGIDSACFEKTVNNDDQKPLIVQPPIDAKAESYYLGKPISTNIPQVTSKKAIIFDAFAYYNQQWSELCEILSSKGEFDLEYLPDDTLRTTEESLSFPCSNVQQQYTVIFFYLRGQIIPNPQGQYLITSDSQNTLDLPWLLQQLQTSNIEQKIIIFDCPETENSLLQELLDSLDNHLLVNQDYAIIAVGKVGDQFAFMEILIDIFKQHHQDLTIAKLIYELVIIRELIGPYNCRINNKYTTKEILVANPKIIPNYQVNICPYQGLKSFERKNAFFFCGRDKLKEKIKRKIKQESILTIIGPSGSGKSSLVKAGVIPDLEKEGFWITIFRPGEDPLASMSLALSNQPPPKQNSLLFIDQFEELFTICPEKERQEFLDSLLNLVETTPKLHLIVILRIDFSDLYFKKLQFKTIVETEVIPPSLSEEEYRQIIINPAKKLKLTVEEDLVKSLVKEGEATEVSLPLLQLALTTLWEEEQKLDCNSSIPMLPGKCNHLTLKTYNNRVGGIAKLLGEIADEAYNQLSSDEQQAAQKIFITLVKFNLEAKREYPYTRSRISLSQLINSLGEELDENIIRNTLYKLVDAKLIVSSSSGLEEVKNQEINYEIIHEVLISQWPTLRTWIEENAEKLRQIATINQRYEMWDEAENKEQDLLKGEILTNAENLKPKFSLEVQKYIEKSRESRDRQEAAEKERRDRELSQTKAKLKAERNTNRVILAGGLISIVLSLIVNNQRIEAEKREIQTSLQLEVEELEDILSSNSVDVLVDIIKLTGKSQKQLKKVLPEIEDKFWQVTHQVRERNVLEKHHSGVTSVAISKDGKYIVSGSRDQTIGLWNIQGELIQILGKHEEEVTSVAISSDGKYIVSGSKDKKICLWSIQGELIKTLVNHTDEITSVAISSDGKYIVSGSKDNTIRLWSFSSGELIKTFRSGDDGEITSVAISSDGKYIVSGSKNKQRTGKVSLWDIHGNLIRDFSGHQEWINTVAISNDGKYILSGSPDQTLLLWSREGELIKTLKRDEGEIFSAAFSSDSKYIVSGSETNLKGLINLWDIEGNLLHVFTGHQKSVNSVAFSNDGKYIVSGSEDSTIRLWDVEDQLTQILTGHEYPITSVATSDDNEYFLTTSEDKTIQWPVTGDRHQELRGYQEDIASLILRKINKIKSIIVHDNRGNVTVLDQDNNLLSRFFNYQFETIVLSSNGYLLTKNDDQSLNLWYISHKQANKSLLLSYLSKISEQITTVAISPDSEYILTGSKNHIVSLLSTDGEQQYQISTNHRDEITSIAFNPQRQQIATGSKDKTVRFWNLEGELIKTITYLAEITSIAFSSDGRYSLTIIPGETVDADHTIHFYLFDHHSQKSKSPPQGFDQHHFTQVIISPNSQYLLAGTTSGKLLLWDIAKDSWQVLGKHNDGQKITAIAFSQDSQSIVSGSEDQNIYLWSLDGNKEHHLIGNHDDDVNAIAFSPDGNYIVSHSYGLDLTIRLWRKQGGEVCQFTHKNPPQFLAVTEEYIFTANKQIIYQLDFNCQPVNRFISHHGFNQPRDFNLEAEYFLSFDLHNNVYFWNDQAEIVHSIALFLETDKSFKINYLVLTHDNQHIFTIHQGSKQDTIYVWDKNGDFLEAIPHKHKEKINSLAMSPDGQYLLSSSQDVILWKIVDNKHLEVVNIFTKHRDLVTSVSFSQDSQYVLSVSQKSIYLRDVNNNLLRSFNYNYHPEIEFNQISFADNGQEKYLLATSKNNAAWLLKVSNWKNLLTISCDRLQHHPLLKLPENQEVKDICIQFAN